MEDRVSGDYFNEGLDIFVKIRDNTTADPEYACGMPHRLVARCNTYQDMWTILEALNRAPTASPHPEGHMAQDGLGNRTFHPPRVISKYNTIDPKIDPDFDMGCSGPRCFPVSKADG